MRRVMVVLLLMGLAAPAGAQCRGDFNGDMQVQINELILAVNNALSGCPPPPCPIDFSDDNTAMGSADCFYRGRWNATCGPADLDAQFVSDGQILIIAISNGLLFFAADVVSPTTAALIGWYQKLDASDLQTASGVVLLQDGGATLVLDPVGAPLVLDNCDFERYDAAFTSTTGAAPAIGDRAAAPIPPATFARLRAARIAGASLRRGADTAK